MCATGGPVVVFGVRGKRMRQQRVAYKMGLKHTGCLGL